MKEIFFGKRHSSYLSKSENEKEKWTSKIKKYLLRYKLITSMLILIVCCFGINIWLINKFIYILQFSINSIF